MAQQPPLHATANFSCYIHVYNKSKFDFGLSDSKAIDGSWAGGSPANTIEAGQDVVIELNDGFGFSGSTGWVKYEVNDPSRSKPDTFTIKFSDPYGAQNDNYLKASSTNPQVVSCNVLDYSPTGHPFTGHVQIYVSNNAISADQNEHASAEMLESLATLPLTSRDSDGKAHVTYEFGFDSALGVFHSDPIHEDMTIAAFILANLSVRFPKATEYSNLNKLQWEYMRGLQWSDDPSCLLYNDNVENNRDWGAGVDFLNAFKLGPPNCMTQRSHFGNLQFIHSMAIEPKEKSGVTKGKVLAWMEVMYKLATGGQGVTEKDRLDQHFPNFFSSSTEPRGEQSLRDLILGSTTKYRRVDIQRRALGHCLHIIQDSYAVGHTLRRLLNGSDLDGHDENGFIRFKPNTFGRLGPIVTFHTYPGQNKPKHDHYDQSKEGRAPRNLNSFNHIIGARDAIEKSRMLIDFFAEKRRWEDGVETFLSSQVFELDGKATDSDSRSDEKFGSLVSSAFWQDADDKANWDYQSGMERKIALLEGGLAFAENRRGPVRSYMARARGTFVTAVKYILAFIGLLLVFVLAQLAMKALAIN